MATFAGTGRSRAHDPEGRRRDVLAAARRLFAARGFEQTSIRAIAAAAGVNQAQVITIFGGKEALFVEAVGRFEIPRDALAGDIGTLGERLARAYVERWETMPDEDPWPALVRSSVSDEASQELLRRELHVQLTVPLAKVLGDAGEGPARNAMVQCLLAGMIMHRYIIALVPSHSLPRPVFESALAALLQHAINGVLTSRNVEDTWP